MKHSTFIIRNMDCPTEEALVRKRLGSVPGIDELAFNLMIAVSPFCIRWTMNSLFSTPYSIELAEPVINESKLELICEDHQVDELVGIIGRIARTGQTEAGWIYVSDIIQAVPIAGRP